MHAVRSASSPGPDRIDIYMMERSVTNFTITSFIMARIV